MRKTYIIVGSSLLLLTIAMITTDTDTKSITLQKQIVQEDSEVVVTCIGPIKLEQIVSKKSVDKKSFKSINSLDFKGKVLNQIDSILSQDSDDISILTKNITEVFECDECIEKLRSLLVADELGKQTLEELVISISLLNSKESADFLIEAMMVSIKSDNIDNIHIIESAFANFDDPEVVKSFASFLYERDGNVELSYDTQYAMEKSIHKTSDRDMVASNLAQMYERLDEDKKVDIITLDHPETMAIIATRAYNQGDMDTYDMMVDTLSKSTKQEALNGFMLLSRKSETDMVNDIAKIASTWSKGNSSQRDMEIAEDYLSRDDITAHEKMVASSMLSNQEDKEKTEHILNKAMDNQDDGDVVAFISEQLENIKE